MLELSKHVHRNADMLLKNLKNVEIPFFFLKYTYPRKFLGIFFLCEQMRLLLDPQYSL